MNIRRKHWIGVAAAMALVTVGSPTAQAGPAVQQQSNVYQFQGIVDVGDASVTRTGSGVTMRIHTAVSGALEDFGTPVGADWTSGDATTVWFVVFNNPAGCVGGCGEDDVLDAIIGDNRAEVGVHYGAGHVASGSSYSAAARLNEGDMTGAVFGMGLKDSMAAEIHLVVRSHGPAAHLTGQQLTEALHSINGGCAPDHGPNTCGDSQFAVFLAP